MGKERKDVKVTPCLCGEGSVNEHFWANDHSFASDYSWHSSGLGLHCEICARAWVIETTVANPVTPPSGRSVVYFVTHKEMTRVRKHNDELDRQSRMLFDERSKLESELDLRVRALRAQLLSQADSAGAGVASKFDAVGSALGFKSLNDFRASVGRTRPATYIEQLLTRKSFVSVLRNLGRTAEVAVVREIQERLLHNSQASASHEAAKQAPIASRHLFYITPERPE